MKHILIALVLATLTGCIDYRSGRHWQASESSQWSRVDKPTKFMGETRRSPYLQWSSAACGAPVLVQTQRLGDSQRMSILLIPLPFGHSAENPEQMRLSVAGKTVSGRCESALSILVNGLPVENPRISACTAEQDCCYVEIPTQRRHMQSLEVRIDNAEMACRQPTLMLRSKGHFCLRGTEFGGSESCAY